jgi:uncharacterized surface anchored protein
LEVSAKTDLYTDEQDAVTNEEGKLEVQRNITDKFTVTSSAYKYYDDYNSLVSTVKEEADKKIAANEIYKSKEDAEAAMHEEQNKLATEYVNEHVSTNTLQATATETKAPDGYVLDPEVHILKNNALSEYTLNDDTALFQYEPVTIDFDILPNLQYLVNKLDAEENFVENAELEVQDTEGNVIDSWVSSAEPHAINGLTTNTSYVLVEKKAPTGYVLANPVAFETTEEHTTTVIMHDGAYTVHLIDEHDVPVEGAKLQIIDEDGNVLEEWTTTEEEYIPNCLEEGKTYTIIEIYTPSGFNQMQPYTFTVTNSKMAIVLRNGATLLYKKSSDNINVKNAELQIKDKDSNVIDEWVSGQNLVTLKDEVFKEADEKGVAYIVEPEETSDVEYTETSEATDNEAVTDEPTSIAEFVESTDTTDTSVSTEDNLDETVSETEEEPSSNTEESEATENEPATLVMQKIKPAYTENCYTLITQYSDGTWVYQEIDKYGNEAGHRASLVTGEDYEFIETKAPTGYKVAATLNFNAKEESTYLVTMIDEYSVEGAINKLVTGIHSNITYLVVGFAAIVVLIVVVVLRKKKHTATN